MASPSFPGLVHGPGLATMSQNATTKMAAIARRPAGRRYRHHHPHRHAL